MSVGSPCSATETARWPVTVSGAGVGGNGAIVNSGNNQSRVLHTVTLAADATFGGTGDWDIRNSSGNTATADAALNGAFNLTKVGTNSLSLRGVTIDSGLGNINVQAGSLTITATASAPQNSLGNSAATATVFSNATFTFDTIGNVPDKNYILTNGGTLKSFRHQHRLEQPGDFDGCRQEHHHGECGPAQFTITSAISAAGRFSAKTAPTILYPDCRQQPTAAARW